MKLQNLLFIIYDSDASIKKMYRYLKSGKDIFTDGDIVSCTLYSNDENNISRILIWYKDQYNSNDRYVIELRLLSNISKVVDANTGLYIWYIKI